MDKREHTVAKLTRPVVKGIFLRERLFTLLDSKDKSLVWVSSPAGSGKTALAASYLDSRKLPCLWYEVDASDSDISNFFYHIGLAAQKANPRKKKPLPLLTPEYLMGVPAFTKKYFEELYSRLKPPFAVVLDNYQDAAPDSGFHEIICIGLEAMPAGLKFIILSRAEPPPHFARLRASGKIDIVGWDKLRFTLEETSRTIMQKEQEALSVKDIKHIHETADGWAAGVVLMTEAAKTRGIIGHDELSRRSMETVFEYFATVIFQTCIKQLQEFLMKTSFLPVMTEGMAEELTGNSSAHHILNSFSRNNYFTERHEAPEPFYQYHPLFREFLLSSAKDYFRTEDLLTIKKTAAALTEKAGYTEAAAGLFIEAKDHEGLSRIILRQAMELIMQGRIKTLEVWITALPQELIENNPWLLYWLGVCRMPFDPMQSRSHFERAFKLFDEQKDSAGAFLAWAGIIDTFVLFWKDFSPITPWINRLYEIMEEYKIFPSPQIESRVTCNMFAALSHSLPHHPDMGLWAERARALLMRASPDSNLRIMTGSLMLTYYSWIGDYAKMTVLVDELRQAVKAPEVTALSQLWACLAEAIYCWKSGSFDACIKVVERGFGIVEASGIHILDGFLNAQAVYASCLRGDYDTAHDYLMKIEKTLNRTNNLELSHYHFLCAFLALAKGDNRLAIELGENNIGIIRMAGIPFGMATSHNVLANAYIETGAYEKAEAHLAEAAAIAHGMRSKVLKYSCVISKAHMAMERGEDRTCLEYLRKALSLTKEMGFVNIFFTRRPTMSRLLAKALEAGIETRQAEQLIQKFRLEPPEGAPETWPYPIKIYTLGSFRIFKDGEQVAFTGKAPQKPLSLLKAIIALGKPDIETEQLTDALWPDADGDTAYISLKTTLHRLRQMLGIEDIIRFDEGRVSLDPQYCWVDIWAFERLAEASPPGLAEKALELYKGDFLSGDKAYDWAISRTEGLKRKFVRLIKKLGRYHEDNGQFEKALELYERALETDELQEEFYRRIMSCCQGLGRKAEAVRVYKRCCSVLEANFGVKPSPETEAVYKKVIVHDKP